MIDQRRLLALLSDLVRIPSENTPPNGAEKGCQEYIAGFLRNLSWAVDLYALDEVTGLSDHPLFWPGRNYADRPNVAARCAGTGGGRSLLLSGHIDTVPRGSRAWLHDPFGAAIEDSRLYGRGALDMKAGIATALLIAETLAQRGIRLCGDLLVESVVDEEFGGVNGTLAGRLRGFQADAAILGEPTGLRICPAHRGGRVAHLTFRAGGDIFADVQGGGAVEQLRSFLDALPSFAARRRENAPRHPLYAHLTEPAPVAVTSISTAPWGPTEPITIPSSCRVELYWQAAPGELQEEMETQFFTWLHDTLPTAPEVQFPIRWLPGSAIEPTHPLVRELAASAHDVMGENPPVEGMEAPCDMYVFHRFGTPAVLWGPRGANAHAPDEYVEIKSLVAAAETLFAFVTRWCGISQEGAANVPNRTSASHGPPPPAL